MAHLPAALRLMQQKNEGGDAPQAKRPRLDVPAAFQQRQQPTAPAANAGPAASAGDGSTMSNAQLAAMMRQQQAMMAMMMASMGDSMGGSSGSGKGGPAAGAAGAMGGKGATMPAAGMRPMMPSVPGPRAMLPNPRSMMAKVAGGAGVQDAMMAELAALANNPAAAMAAAQVPNMNAAQKPARPIDELREIMLNMGCPVLPGLTARDMEKAIAEAEAFVRRAKRTKELPRHDDQELLRGFREGWFSPGCEELVRQLEAGCNPDVKSEGFSSGFAPGMTPLLAAVGWGKPDEVRILLAAGADIFARTPNTENTALHLATGGNIAAWGYENTQAMIKILLDAEPRLAQMVNSQKKTPLEWGKLERRPKQVKMLQDMGIME